MKVFCKVCYELEVDTDDKVEAMRIASFTPYHDWQLATDMTCCPCEDECSVEEDWE